MIPNVIRKQVRVERFAGDPSDERHTTVHDRRDVSTTRSNLLVLFPASALPRSDYTLVVRLAQRGKFLVTGNRVVWLRDVEYMTQAAFCFLPDKWRGRRVNVEFVRKRRRRARKGA